MNTTLDVAAVLSAILWPAVAVTVLLAYQKDLARLATALARRLNKLEAFGVAVELATAKAVSPELVTPGGLDLRHTATSFQIYDSNAQTFIAQLARDDAGQCAIVRLGFGRDWLTSRLFILAIFFARSKGVSCLLFLDASQGVRDKVVGIASTQAVRWRLAMRYPWLEAAYARAYAKVWQPVPNYVRVVTPTGRLGRSQDPDNTYDTVAVLKEFLEILQTPAGEDPVDRVTIDPATNTSEHARWLKPDIIEDILGDSLQRRSVPMARFEPGARQAQVKEVLSIQQPFVPIVSDGGRFEFLVDRERLMEQVAEAATRQDE